MLSDEEYDNDAASLHSTSNQELESDSEIDLARHGLRTSRDIREHDRSLLREEDERDELLRTKGPLDGIKRMLGRSQAEQGMDTKISKREQRRQRRRSSRRRNEKKQSSESAEGELMFEMEEGFKDTSSLSSDADSMELDKQAWERPDKPVSEIICHVQTCSLTLIVPQTSIPSSRCTPHSSIIALLRPRFRSVQGVESFWQSPGPSEDFSARSQNEWHTHFPADYHFDLP